MLRHSIAALVLGAAFGTTALAADPCAQTRTAKVTFTSPGDIVTATSIPGPVVPAGGGDNCRGATVVLTIHTVEGVPVTAYASSLVAASFDAGHTEAPVPAAQLGAFLDSWIKVEMTTSDKAPAFGSECLTTTLAKTEYDAIRSAKAPMLCYQASAFDRTCLAPDSSNYIVGFFTIEET